MSEFIFMLTRNDRTVADAIEVFQQIRDTGVRYVGFKDVGLPFEEMARLVDAIHAAGLPVMLEVVSVSEESELRSVEIGRRLNVDYVLGGTRAAQATAILNGSAIRYFPFPGRIVGHPSLLRGTCEEIVESARRLASMDGVDGLDLLAYRFDGDVEHLIARVLEAVDVPVVLAGSIDSPERVGIVSRLNPWGFTIGSAIFAGQLSPVHGGLRGQIRAALAAAGQKV